MSGEVGGQMIWCDGNIPRVGEERVSVLWKDFDRCSTARLGDFAGPDRVPYSG